MKVLIDLSYWEESNNVLERSLSLARLSIYLSIQLVHQRIIKVNLFVKICNLHWISVSFSYTWMMRFRILFWFPKMCLCLKRDSEFKTGSFPQFYNLLVNIIYLCRIYSRQSTVCTVEHIFTIENNSHFAHTIISGILRVANLKRSTFTKKGARLKYLVKSSMLHFFTFCWSGEEMNKVVFFYSIIIFQSHV